MPQEVLNILLSALGVIVTGLASWGVAMLTKWINSKISDKKAAEFINRIMKIITDAVMAIYQQFVEVLKNQGKFGPEEQKEAKNKALEIIQSQLTPELKEYITNNYGDIVPWLSSQIEAVLYTLKNKCK